MVGKRKYLVLIAMLAGIMAGLYNYTTEPEPEQGQPADTSSMPGVQYSGGWTPVQTNQISFTTVAYDGCEYLTVYIFSGSEELVGFTHKGNCTNKAHQPASSTPTENTDAEFDIGSNWNTPVDADFIHPTEDLVDSTYVDTADSLLQELENGSHWWYWRSEEERAWINRAKRTIDSINKEKDSISW